MNVLHVCVLYVKIIRCLTERCLKTYLIEFSIIMSLFNLFSAHLSADEMVRDNDKIAALLLDRRERYTSCADIVLSPTSTQSVQKIMRICWANKIPVVPIGGNTGLCGGATINGGVLLSLEKLNQINPVNTADRCITVGSGCLLYQVQQAAKDAGLFFPLSLASEGSCQIGGNIAANAGGINVLRYGTMRDLVLGLEVVLPNGEMISSLQPLHKNTAGLDLKHLFIGSEGTLGVITAATLKLFLLPQQVEALWADCQTIDDCINLLNLLQKYSLGSLKSFELISHAALMVSANDLRTTPPTNAAWHILCEWEKTPHTDRLPETLLQHGFEHIFIAQNEQQRQNWWRLRENISAAQKRRGVSIKHDIALSISKLADFVLQCEKNIQAAFANAEIVLFGHLGDGSLHYNIFLPDYPDKTAYQFENQINSIVYQTVLQHNGTIAAEHGVGILKKHWLKNMRNASELVLMQAIKQHFDPDNIMNPNKVYP